MFYLNPGFCLTLTALLKNSNYFDNNTKMRKITLQKKLIGLFIIILGMGTYTKGMELGDYLHPTTGDTIYLDPVNTPLKGF
ncbi:MAG: hypothetical protein DRJ13_17335 [Bacteroidetes bacterium]|nr:MAG: hypothetical protein DRJ13_17335 [Bacteroidota bacterium]